MPLTIIHQKPAISKIPPYYKGQSVPIILYAYTVPIVTTIFNYKKVLHDLNIVEFKYKPPKFPIHIIRIATLYLVTVTLSARPLYKMCSLKDHNSVSLNQ